MTDDEDYHDVVTLMHDQLDALQQMPSVAMGMQPTLSVWIATTRSLLPERGHRG